MAKRAANPSPSTPSPNRPRRPEDWPPTERLRVVVEASRLSDEELGEFLRREGLHEATLRQWRSAALEALEPARKGRSEQRRVRELEKQLRRKDKALAEAAALLVLQKNSRARSTLPVGQKLLIAYRGVSVGSGRQLFGASSP